MTESKSGWPLTKEFADGLTSFLAKTTAGVLALREVALDAIEVAVTTQEVLVVTRAKAHYANERGARASYWELYQWAKDNGQPQLASFLYANRRNYRITGLFGRDEPSIEPPEGP